VRSGPVRPAPAHASLVLSPVAGRAHTPLRLRALHRAAALRAAALLALFALLLAAPAALAFCRTTTCSARCPAPDCLRPDAAADAECAARCQPDRCAHDDQGGCPARCVQRDASGCLTGGIPVAWAQPCLSYSVVQQGSSRLGLDYDQLPPLAQAGFDLWPNALCAGGPPAIAVTSLPSLTCDDHEYNPTGPNANGVYFRDAEWPYPDQPDAIAITGVTFNGRTGQILDADMEINTFTFGSRLSPHDLEYTIGHESGHFFGLDHSSDPNALMYYSYSGDAISAPVLQADDTAAICAAYPSTGAPPVCRAGPLDDPFEPAHGFARDCGGDVIGGCAVAPARGRRAAGDQAAAALLLAAALLPGALSRARARSARRRTG